MERGFLHFERNHTENFSAAVLCLLLEVVPEAREAFVALLDGVIEPRLGHRLGALRLVERERRLEGNDDKDYQRPDLRLSFENGDVVLVEVKTRWWDVDHVVGQLDGYAKTAGSVVLLAPTGLADAVAMRRGPGGKQRPAVAWAKVFSALRHYENPLVLRALKHWEANVETSFGINVPFDGFDGSVRIVACLREFLRACAVDAGERPEDGLNLTGWGGEPWGWKDWKWHGLSVPLKRNTHARIGVYKYVAAPPGRADSLDGAWLELYRDDPNEPYAFMAFNPPDLSPAALDKERAAFRKQLALVETLSHIPGITVTRDGDDYQVRCEGIGIAMRLRPECVLRVQQEDVPFGDPVLLVLLNVGGAQVQAVISGRDLAFEPDDSVPVGELRGLAFEVGNMPPLVGYSEVLRDLEICERTIDAEEDMDRVLGSVVMLRYFIAGAERLGIDCVEPLARWQRLWERLSES